jgi:hypothetical protein
MVMGPNKTLASSGLGTHPHGGTSHDHDQGSSVRKHCDT